MSSIHRSVAILILGAGSALHAGAQSTLPPPPPRPAMPEYVPPSQRPAPAQARPARPADQARPAFDPKTVEFEPIWSTGDDGSFIGPDTYAELAALRNNPLISQDQWDFVQALIDEREAEMELVAQSHPRACVEALTSAIAAFDINDQASRTRLADIALVLNQPRGIIDTIAEQGVLSPEMAAMAHHITMDFTFGALNAIPASLGEDANPDEVTNLQSRFLMRQGLTEPLAAFGRLARRAIEANPSLVDNPDALLAIKGNAFIDEAARALAPLDDDTLKAAITGAYETTHGPVVK